MFQLLIITGGVLVKRLPRLSLGTKLDKRDAHVGIFSLSREFHAIQNFVSRNTGETSTLHMLVHSTETGYLFMECFIKNCLHFFLYMSELIFTIYKLADVVVGIITNHNCSVTTKFMLENRSFI